jgi:hypothetical protein
MGFNLAFKGLIGYNTKGYKPTPCVYIVTRGVVLLRVPNNTSLCRTSWTVQSGRSCGFSQHVIQSEQPKFPLQNSHVLCRKTPNYRLSS